MLDPGCPLVMPMVLKFGQVLVAAAVSFFLAHVFDDTIRVDIHLNQYCSEHNMYILTCVGRLG